LGRRGDTMKRWRLLEKKSCIKPERKIIIFEGAVIDVSKLSFISNTYAVGDYPYYQYTFHAIVDGYKHVFPKASSSEDNRKRRESLINQL
jgi:hypothetical protein